MKKLKNIKQLHDSFTFIVRLIITQLKNINKKACFLHAARVGVNIFFIIK
jgi:hypothetical protein